MVSPDAHTPAQIPDMAGDVSWGVDAAARTVWSTTGSIAADMAPMPAWEASTTSASAMTNVAHITLSPREIVDRSARRHRRTGGEGRVCDT